MMSVFYIGRYRSSEMPIGLTSRHVVLRRDGSMYPMQADGYLPKPFKEDLMAQTAFKGSPVQLSGDLPQPGTDAPDFTLTRSDLSDVSLKDYAGKTVVLNIFPSIDTPVCAMSVRKFNAEIGNKNFELDMLEEAYTTEHWIVRIYKVKDLPNRGGV